MYQPKANVKYMAIDPVASRVTGKPEVRWYTMLVTKGFVKTYSYAAAVMITLSPSARIVLDIALEKMDEENYVTNSAKFKQDLQKLVQAHGKDLSNNTINKAFSDLAKEEIMINCEKRGLYRVNPIYFFKGTQKDREKAIRHEAEKSISQIAEKIRSEFVVKRNKSV